MKQVIFTVKSNTPIAKSVYQMELCGDVGDITAPGQFINLKVDGMFLRRPISVCSVEKDTLTILYKVVGEGTACMSRWQPGRSVDALSGLGNGYDLTTAGDAPLLVGGGVGVPPMYELAKQLIRQGKSVQVILGFGSAEEVFYEKEFLALGAKVYITTADGSYGTRGFVTDVMRELSYSYFYTCGPMPMFLAMEKVASTGGQYSFEERMGCGFGACMGCSCKTLTGNKRICIDGPVMKREEILWPTQK